MKSLTKKYQVKMWNELTDDEKQKAEEELREDTFVDDILWERNNEYLDNEIKELNKKYSNNEVRIGLESIFVESYGGWLALEGLQDLDITIYPYEVKSGNVYYNNITSLYINRREIKYVTADDLEYEVSEDKLENSKRLLNRNEKIINTINDWIEEMNILINKYCDCELVDIDGLVQEILEQQEYTYLVEETENEEIEEKEN